MPDETHRNITHAIAVTERKDEQITINQEKPSQRPQYPLESSFPNFSLPLSLFFFLSLTFPSSQIPAVQAETRPDSAD